jgi:hypothetical protein
MAVKSCGYESGCENLVYFSRKFLQNILYIFYKNFAFSQKVSLKSHTFFAKIFSKMKNADFRKNVVYFRENFWPNFCKTYISTLVGGTGNTGSQ